MNVFKHLNKTPAQYYPWITRLLLPLSPCKLHNVRNFFHCRITHCCDNTAMTENCLVETNLNYVYLIYPII